MGDGSTNFEGYDPNQPNNPPPEDDDPLGGLDPMAWLESLAARQGAKSEEFMTAADLDVPEIDPDSVVIDEPGYTPYEVFGEDTSEIPAAQDAPPPSPAPEPPMPAPQPNASADMEMGIPEGVDPMAWLESLAARQGANREGFTTEANIEIAEIDPDSVVIDEPGYTPSETIQRYHMPPEEPAPQEFTPSPEPQMPTPPEATQPPADEMGIPEGVDPMAWLESLAARAGADAEGFTTEANIDIPEIDPDSVTIDEPGYTPSETIQRYHTPPEEAPPATPQPTPPPPAPGNALADRLFGGQATRSQAPEDFLDELADQADEIPGFGLNFGQSADDDAPAYDTPQASEPAAEEDLDFDEMFFEDDEQIAAVNLDSGPQAWSAEPEDDLGLSTVVPSDEGDASWLDALDTAQPEPTDPSGPPPNDLEAIPATHTAESLLESIDGLSDEEIARRQAAGELTGEQELAWLMRQAKGLQQAREEMPQTFDDEDLPPAEAGEIPEWLQQSAIITDDLDDDIDASDAFFDDISALPEPDDVPEWLTDEEAEPQPEPELQLPDFTLEAVQEAPEEPEAPPPSAPEPEQAQATSAFGLHLNDYDPSEDEWAEALDEEHERLQSDQPDRSPTWLREAMQQVEEDAPDAEEPTQASAPSEVAEPEASPAAPEWLGEVQEEAPTDEMATPDDMPTWLRGEGPSGPVADVGETDIPDDLPDWLRPAAAGAESSLSDEDLDDIGTWLREEETGGSIYDLADADAESMAAPAEAVAQSPRPANDISNWLRDQESSAAPAYDLAAADLPPEASERFDQGRPGPVPAWAMVTPPAAPSPSAPAPAPQAATPPPSPQPTTPPAAPAARTQPAGGTIRHDVAPNAQPAPPPSPPPPVPVGFDEYEARISENPDDHAARLALARGLVQRGDIQQSVPQYENLVESMTELDQVAEDLHALIPQNPQHPALRRLLGDVYMRQGYLQEALDAYRGALDNL